LGLRLGQSSGQSLGHGLRLAWAKAWASMDRHLGDTRASGAPRTITLTFYLLLVICSFNDPFKF
jgi:hypothetical protein